MTEGKSPFVTIESLAQYFHVSVSTIRAWVRQGHIPETTYIKLGNTYRFNRDQVAEALTTMQKEVELDSETVSISATGVVGSTTITANNDNEQLELNFDADDDV